MNLSPKLSGAILDSRTVTIRGALEEPVDRFGGEVDARLQVRAER